jgi:hypothetical protein
MKREFPQVGAPDPELSTSPIIDEAEHDETAGLWTRKGEREARTTEEMFNDRLAT